MEDRTDRLRPGRSMNAPTVPAATAWGAEWGAKTMEAVGGRERFLQRTQEYYDETMRHWECDTELIGRVLRAHLFVEHGLNIYLKGKNPNLGDVTQVRGFDAKIALIDPTDYFLLAFISGIKRLNKVRNRIAHTLAYSVTQAAADSFLSNGFLQIMRDAEDKRSADPIDVLEDFAQLVGVLLRGQVDPAHLEFQEASEKVLAAMPPFKRTSEGGDA